MKNDSESRAAGQEGRILKPEGDTDSHRIISSSQNLIEPHVLDFKIFGLMIPFFILYSPSLNRNTSNRETMPVLPVCYEKSNMCSYFTSQSMNRNFDP